MTGDGTRTGGRVLAAALVLALVGGLGFTGVAAAAARRARSCIPRTLVLSAMPVELGPLLGQVRAGATVTAGGRDYVLGRLRGHDVVLALTGIGPVNARAATRQALAEFRCGTRPAIDGVLFSGVAGGDFIGDVVVPARWTQDDGRHLLGVDPRMLAAARRVAAGEVRLEQRAPAGDPACACVTSPHLVATVTVTHRPRVEVGGTGQTTDPFSGRALPCVPGGGDVFGCEPCPEQKKLVRDARSFLPGIVPFLDPAFFTGYFGSTSGSGRYVTEDEETAAVDAVAAAHGVPFIGFRAVSDGGGDPLHLPGFPAQFFYYRQLAADNAAAATLAFLSTWRSAPAGPNPR